MGVCRTPYLRRRWVHRPFCVAAQILHGFGRLEAHFLDCDSCDSWDKEARGCGARPSIEGAEWSPEAFRAEAKAEGLSGDAEREEARGRYHLALFGGLHKRIGLYWPMCPRWYLDHAPEDAREVAKRALKVTRFVRLGDPSAVRGAQLTPAGAALVEQASSLWDYQQSEYEKREFDKARREK